MDRRLFLSALLGGPVAASLPAAAATLAAPLRRGMNIHHLLNWPAARGQGTSLSYQMPPFGGPAHQISDAEITRLAAHFDFVRLTIDPAILISLSGQSRIALLDTILHTTERFLERDIRVIADLHPISQNPAYDPAVLVKDIETPAFAAFTAAAADLAAALAGHRSAGIILELMNEPRLMSLDQLSIWQAMIGRLHDVARQRAPDLPLMVTGLQGGSIGGLTGLDPTAFKGGPVYYTFHYYNPYPFTHQGVGGDATQYLKGVRWPTQPTQARSLSAEASVRLQADIPDGDRRRTSVASLTRLLGTMRIGGDARAITSDFGRVAAWAKTYGIPTRTIVLGEFGCVVTSPSEDRLAWLQAVRQTAERFGFPWAYWAYKGYGGMGLVDEGAADPGSPIMKALGI